MNSFIAVVILIFLKNFVQANVPNDFRIDCIPDPPVTAERCHARGCQWTSKVNDSDDFSFQPVGVPSCYFDTGYVGYKTTETLSDEKYLNLTLERIRPSGLPNDIQNLLVNVYRLSENVVRIHITDKWKSRYEVPTPKLDLPQRTKDKKDQYVVSYYANKMQNFVIWRHETSEKLFSTNLAQLIYADQFIQMAIQIPTNHIYGLGENYSPFRKSTEWKRYTMFRQDNNPKSEVPLYGSHPFYLAVEKSRYAHGLFLLNSNAMDILTQPAPSIVFRPIGGILDFFLFLGPTAEEVIQQYHQLIGKPALPPFWSLGFHLSRYGYNNYSNLHDVYSRNVKSLIPLDVQWTDIDTLDQENIFTLDIDRFGGLPTFISGNLHDSGRKFITLIESTVSNGEPLGSYPPYDLGLKMNLFVKNIDHDPFLAKVWYNKHPMVWIDFWNPNATEYWTKLLEDYQQYLQFDGVGIGMVKAEGQLTPCPLESKRENPPYRPGKESGEPLRYDSMCMTAVYYAGLHYDLNNLYQLQEAIVTYGALKTVMKNKRPFIISQSTAPGIGKYSGHWLTMYSDWSSLKMSISASLNSNLFGIPMAGADICGSRKNTNEELCARWHQLGAFYGFSRNHKDDLSIDQDPVALGPVVTKAAIKALMVRYVHLQYFYTFFWFTNIVGGTVLRPLFFEFPNDNGSYEIEEKQFMVGSDIMVAPVLESGITKMKVYFPPGRWTKLLPELELINSSGQYIEQNSSLNDYPNFYYRGGSIVPIQEAQATTVEQLQYKPNYTLVATLNESGYAYGRLYWDIGDSFEYENDAKYFLYFFEAKNNQTLRIATIHFVENFSNFLGRITKILILGVEKPPKSISFNSDRIDNFKQYNQTLQIGTESKPLNLVLGPYRSYAPDFNFKWQF